MGLKNFPLAILLSMLVGYGSSDFAQDRAECANDLVGLSTCLPYVSGTAKAPTLDCCTGLKTVLDKSRKCLCVLIKDRDNPNLGIKFNATLAAALPASCHSPVNVTECIDLLHLPPSSPDAKVFAGFANMTKGSSATPTTGTSGNSTSSGTRADDKSGSEMAKSSKWVGVETICGFLLWALVSFGI